MAQVAVTSKLAASCHRARDKQPTCKKASSCAQLDGRCSWVPLCHRDNGSGLATVASRGVHGPRNHEIGMQAQEQRVTRIA
jgi:hypothetical protein